jgi:cation diffusion facilitator CzcD-associated flavoprotein CzcO
MSDTDAVVIGAGPYGLSAAAHLGAAGIETRTFGDTMAFWQEKMPAGMLLRSPWPASHLSDPDESFTLDSYRAEVDPALAGPVPLASFVAYGQWFQKHAVPTAESRRVAMVTRNRDGYDVSLDDGETVRARRVVVATGIERYASIPALFRPYLGQESSHSSDHSDLSCFEGRKVAVVGGGQSALESAALLHEAGAEVVVLVRKPVVHWLKRSARLHRLGPVSRLLYAPSDIGPAGVSQLVAWPKVFRRIPRRAQDRLATRAIRPAGSAWLPPRLREVDLRLGRWAVEVRAEGGVATLRLDNGDNLTVDHVLCATGYRIDVAAGCPMLAPEIRRALHLVNGYPRLHAGMESSMPGLHFLGAPAAWSFGPLTRFVAGAAFSSRNLTEGIRNGRR